MKIGVFDSGLGGLSILKDIIKTLPQYDYVYLGDNARVPYGGRSPQLIYQFTVSALEFLFKQDCRLVILACNTASATALRQIQHQYLPKKYPDRRVLGVIKPAVERVSELGITRIGVIGTYATINSEAFVHEIKKLSAGFKVFQQACPLLVPIVEEGEIEWIGLPLILKKYLLPLKKQKIKALILGCTHYGLIAKKIQSVLGKNIEVISEGKEVAEKLRSYLNKHRDIKNKLSKNQKREFFVTDLSNRYQEIAKMFFGKKIKLTHHPIS